MLKIKRTLINRVKQATRAEDLHEMVQTAIVLEHATIPTYLCALYTLKPGTNQEVAEIIRSVIIEEMLHMTIASNLLIAIGGSPRINTPDFIPTYPGPLPDGIGGDLIVTLEKCSIAQVRDVFMKIEEPTHPLPLRAAALGAEETEYGTIGEFYAAIDAKLHELGQAAFTGDVSKEMVNNSWFPANELFPITGPDSASRAIEVIVSQGEGRSKAAAAPARAEAPAALVTASPDESPLDFEGAPAHYYRFEQIVRGRKLVANAEAPYGYSFTGAPIVLDERNVWNMQPNPDPETLPAGSRARRLSDQFDFSYTLLLNTLHQTFNGQPALIDRAMGQMYELRLLAQEVLSTPVPGQEDQATGLAFRYQPFSV